MTLHPKLICPDCGGERDARAKRCISCHLDRKRLPTPTCVDCGAIITQFRSPRCRPCSALARRARRVRPDGYVQVLRPGHPLARRDGYVFEHRLVVYEAGIEIAPGYQVHHRNGDRQDNRIENLEVVRIDEHARRHAHERGAITNQYGTFPLRRVPTGAAVPGVARVETRPRELV